MTADKEAAVADAVRDKEAAVADKVHHELCTGRRGGRGSCVHRRPPSHDGRKGGRGDRWPTRRPRWPTRRPR